MPKANKPSELVENTPCAFLKWTKNVPLKSFQTLSAQKKMGRVRAVSLAASLVRGKWEPLYTVQTVERYPLPEHPEHPKNCQFPRKHIESASLEHIGLKPGILLLARQLKASASNAIINGYNCMKTHLSVVCSSCPALKWETTRPERYHDGGRQRLLSLWHVPIL